ncbi:WD-40 repeat protein [Kalymmatonema gypsitolerans NIES-4073]|nr:WD-40 repeat protein [Scytonema sp. NIES-4073]
MSNVRTRLAELSSEEIEHFLGEVPRLCLEGGQLNKLCRLLTDFDFIEAKINHPKFGVQALIEDYDLIDGAELLSHPEYDLETVKALELIQGALRLSAHILIQDTKQVAEQFWGRLQCFQVPKIQAILEQAKQSKTLWFRPLTLSFTPPGGRLLRTLAGHCGSVKAILVTPDSKRVISGSSDCTLKVWDLKTGKELHTLTGHSNSVYALTVTPDGKRVISGSSDSTLKVWNLETGEELHTLTGHRASVNALTVTPDGKQVISGSSDSTLKVWNLETGEELHTLTGHTASVNALTVTPDGKRVISGSYDCTLKVWNLETAEELFTFNRHLSSVIAVFITPDGKRVLSVSSNNNLKVWDLETRKELSSVTYRGDRVSAVTVTRDGLRVIFCSSDNTLKAWNPDTTEELISLKDHSAPVNAIAVTPDGLRVISGSRDKTLKVWNLETRKELSTLTGHSAPVNTVAITPDGLRVISGLSDNTLKVWNLQTREEVSTLSGHSAPVNAVAITPDGLRVISGSSDNTLIVQKLRTRQGVFSFITNLIKIGQMFTSYVHSAPVNAVAITPDGLQVIFGSSDNTLKVWNFLTMGEKLFPFDAQQDSSNAVVTYKSKQRISSSLDISENSSQTLVQSGLMFHFRIGLLKKTLTIWYLVTEKKREKLTLNPRDGTTMTSDFRWAIYFSENKNLIVQDMNTGEEVSSLSSFYPGKNKYLFLDSNGKLFIDFCHEILPEIEPDNNEFHNTTLRNEHPVTEHKSVAQSHQDSINAVAVASNGSQVISGSSDCTLKVWNLETGEQLFTLTGHRHSVCTVTVTPDCKLAISGSSDCTLKVWNLETGEQLFTLTGHSASVNAVTVTPNGKYVISAANDNTLIIWNLDSRKAIASFTGESPFSCCAVAPDGWTIVAGDSSGRVHFLRLEGMEA